MKTTMRWTLAALALTVLPAEDTEAQDRVMSGVEIAEQLEESAATLHDRADRWADAATLYETAAELRPGGDPRAQKNLFLAANLYLETGSVGSAIEALETAGARALASGDPVLARERFADAALVAQRAGLSREHQRLAYRTAEVATAERLTTAAR